MGARNMLNTISMVYHTHTVASHTTRLYRACGVYKFTECTPIQLHLTQQDCVYHGAYQITECTHIRNAYRPVQPLSGSLV
ncbi:hypothetical protein GBAR_LOCUS13331, partial [Geodia barretti]